MMVGLEADRERNTGWHGLAFKEHGAGAALAAVTAGLGSGETGGLAQVVHEQLILGHRVLTPVPIEPHAQDAPAGDGLLDFAHVSFLTVHRRRPRPQGAARTRKTRSNLSTRYP